MLSYWYKGNIEHHQRQSSAAVPMIFVIVFYIFTVATIILPIKVKTEKVNENAVAYAYHKATYAYGPNKFELYGICPL